MFVGEIGIDANYFLYELKMFEAEKIQEGYERKQYNSWSQTRLICYYSVAPHMKKGNQTSIEKFMPLALDDKKCLKPKMTEEERKNLENKMVELRKKERLNVKKNIQHKHELNSQHKAI